MRFRTFVRPLLWFLLCLTIATVGAYLATDLGLVDWVRDIGAEAWLNTQKDTLQSRLNIKGESIDRAMKIVGLVSTIIFGAIGLLNVWYHGEDSLPERMTELNNRVTAMHVEDRGVLTNPYRARNLKGDQT